MSDQSHRPQLPDGLNPQVRSGAFVFVTLPSRSSVPVEATVVEDQGITHVVARDVADGEGWDYDFVGGWITLGIKSTLHQIGLTAAVSSALARREISCNVLAGRHHDHLLVPLERLDDALLVLSGLADD